MYRSNFKNNTLTFSECHKYTGCPRRKSQYSGRSF